MVALSHGCRRLLCALASASALFALWTPLASAQQADGPSERQIKAAFLIRFTDYVQWPAGSLAAKESPLVIGVVGDNGIGSELAALAAGRTAQGHPLAVRVFRERDAIAGAHVLFVAESASPQLRTLSRAVEGPVLVVSETEDGLSRGAVINFVLVDRRVRFEVALGTAQARNLMLASGLLSVALNVRKDTRLPPSWLVAHTCFCNPIARQTASVADFKF